jgi:hypothetical protein
MTVFGVLRGRKGWQQKVVVSREIKDRQSNTLIRMLRAHTMMWHRVLLLDQNITLYWNVLGVYMLPVYSPTTITRSEFRNPFKGKSSCKSTQGPYTNIRNRHLNKKFPSDKNGLLMQFLSTKHLNSSNRTTFKITTYIVLKTTFPTTNIK